MKESLKDAVFAAMLIVASIFIMVATASAQERRGNTFILSSHQKDTLVTKYTVEDSKGVERPIVINRFNGHCYVIRKSEKTGKYYRQYLNGSISETVAKELNIPYISTKKKLECEEYFSLRMYN